MKAIVYDAFGSVPKIENVKDPTPNPDGVVLKVNASGLCLSDWHGWVGHDSTIPLPHVPGHELAGEIVEIGRDIQNWKIGDRVTVPFVCGCGHCQQCENDNQHICDNQFQPGFTAWGSFAEYVAIDYADLNLVPLPNEIDDVTAASLGCRFVTAFRAIVYQGDLHPHHWVAVHGCGGVGLSAIMIAKAKNARVIAIDINDETLEFAKSIGADFTINASSNNHVVDEIKSISKGGVNLSLDAVGRKETCFNSISNLQKQGTHVQVGLMLGEHLHPEIPMDVVIANELNIKGSHGMQAHKYMDMMQMIRRKELHPENLIREMINLEDAAIALPKMNEFQSTGIRVINEF